MTYISTLNMEATCSSETSADFQRTTRRYIPVNMTLHSVDTFTIHLHNKVGLVYTWGAGIAQSVERLATGGTTEGSEFESRWG
jgi:hypothetical protein